MKKEIAELVKSLCRTDVEDSVLEMLCEAACERLDGLLRDGVTAQDCAHAYLPAAAWLVMHWLRQSRNWEGITSLSAGDMTIRRGSGGDTLEQQAMELLGPWMKDRGFVFRGVKG